MRRVVPLLALCTVTLATSGCSSLWRGASFAPAVAPSGLPWGEELVRRALVMGTYDQAMARTATRGDGAPNDDLLRALFHGQAAYYAGEWEQSTAAFAEADRLTEARYTKSAARGLLSILGNDRVLRYVPARTERLFSPYYAMLARVQSGDVDGAMVDARRLSALLEASANDLDADEHATHAMLREVVGAVFEVGGEWNDAGVAYRNAALLRGRPQDEVDAMLVVPPPPDSATLLVVVESGFVAHYVAESVAFPLGDASRRSRNGRVAAPGSAGGPWAAADQPTAWLAALEAEPGGGVFAAAVDDASIAPVSALAGAGADGSVASVGNVAADWTPNRVRRRRVLGDRGWGGDWLDVSWPVLVRPRLPVAPVILSLAGERLRETEEAAGEAAGVEPGVEPGETAGLEPEAPEVAATAWHLEAFVPTGGAWAANISDAVAVDARRLRGPRLARLAARTVTRVVAVEAVREKHGPAAGAILGLVVSAVERADTRGWHLLPGRLSLVRVTVPAGRVEPALQVGGSANPVPLALQSFWATPGSVYVQAARVWRDPAGTPMLARGTGKEEISFPH